MIATLELNPGNSIALRLSELNTATTETFENAATVTGELRDAANVALAPPVTFIFANTGDGRGNYEAVIPHTAGIVAGQAYYVHVNADAGPNKVGHWEYEARAIVRRA